MRKLTLLLICATCSCGMAFADDAKPLGKMDGFYRYTAVLGPMLETGYQVMAMPGWMQETDFPYQRRPYDKEIPFADGLSVVRLLGAGKTSDDADKSGGAGDLVIRDTDGQLKYRWDALKARLDPYIRLGYTDLTLVMDNIPWCFPETPVPAEYGQKAPPSDYQEWYAFMKAMCAELKTLYGDDITQHFRFRMGTEMQDTRRWLGGFDGYLQYYDLAAKAVAEELPAAGLGPFNRSVPQGGEEVSIVKLAEHCAENRLPFDFLARSYYYFSTRSADGVLGNITPGQRVPELQALWEQIDQILGHRVSREVQEFGPHLKTEEGVYGMDTGARGAAQAFDTVVELKKAGINRLWHWQLFEKITPDKPLLYSHGWLYSVFDHMRGGELYALPVQTDEDHGNLHRALISVHPDRAVLVVSCWNEDRTLQTPDMLTVQIPQSVCAGTVQSVRQLSFTEETSVYDVIRRDLSAAGMLSEKHRKHHGSPATSVVESGYDRMAADRNAGVQFLSDHWKKYEQLMRDALCLSDFDGKTEQNSGGLTVSFTAQNPSVTVIVLNFETEKTGNQ